MNGTNYLVTKLSNISQLSFRNGWLWMGRFSNFDFLANIMDKFTTFIPLFFYFFQHKYHVLIVNKVIQLFMRKVLFIILYIISSGIVSVFGQVPDTIHFDVDDVEVAGCGPLVVDSGMAVMTIDEDELVPPGYKFDIYDYPYSRTRSVPNWKRLWVNTSVLMGAGVATMVILEALPQESTAWNKRSNSKIPLFKRWVQHVKRGPVWDGDNLIFNYVLHPYAGAAYYMGARGLGFNCLGSFVYSFCISTFFWEYGFEAFNEIPSVQDLIITPVVGSILGEGFYIVKRHIVRNDYRLLGSKVLGYAIAWLVDPLNETIGYFYGDQKKRHHPDLMKARVEGESWIAPSNKGLAGGVTVRVIF